MGDCELNGELNRYHDGRLAEPARARLEAHLAECANCAAALEQLRRLSTMLRDAHRPKASAELMSRLAALSAEVEDATVVRFARRLTAAAAAIVLATTLQWSLSRPSAPVVPVTVSAAPLGSDERMLVDPEAVANSALPDSSVASASPPLDAMSAEWSGGQP